MYSSKNTESETESIYLILIYFYILIDIVDTDYS